MSRHRAALVVTLGLALAVAVPAHAGTIDLEWHGDAQAVDYRIYQSADKGASWTIAATVLQPSPFPADGRIRTTLTLPAALPTDGLILYRAASRNGHGETIRTDAGAWKNPLWQLPVAPSGTGVQ